MVVDAPHRTFRTAREFCEACGCQLSDAARALVADDRQSLADFFRVLLERHLYADAVRFAGVSLPSREGVWWGCLCGWHDARTDPAGREEAALRAALVWVQDQTDDARRAAGAAGRAAKATTPAGGVALAAFFSGGSLAPPKSPAVAPKPFLAGRTVAAAVLAAARRGGAAGTELRLRQYLKLVVEIAEGKTRWEARPQQGERATRPA